MTDGEDSRIEQDGADRPDDPASPADNDDAPPAGGESADGSVGVEQVSDDGDAADSDPADVDGSADVDGPADVEGSESGRSTTADPAAVPAALVERVEEASADEIAAEIAGLREELAAETERVEAFRDRLDEHRERADEREDRIEALETKLKRKQADFQNFKKRNERKLEQELERATEDLVVRLLDVRDNLARGLEQDGDIRDGVESTLRQLDDVLDAEGATRIDPGPGDPVDPESHEVLMRVASAQPEGTVADVHRPGYEMGDTVIRTAQVLVSDGSEHEPDGDAAAETAGTADPGSGNADGPEESDAADSS